MQCKEDKEINTVSEKTRTAIKATEVKIRSMFADIREMNNLKDTYCDSILLVAIKNLVDIYNIYICNEVNKAEEWCRMNIEFMKGQELTPKYIILAIVTRLQLNSILYTKNAQLEERYSCLSEALFLYCTYTAKETYSNPIVYEKLNNGRETNPNVILDSLHINTLEELIRIYIFFPHERHEFVLYMHKLLKDTMEEALLQSGHLEWSITCANLVFYFIYHNRFREAKSHLLIASKILLEYFNTEVMNKIKTDKTSDLEIDLVSNRYYNAMFAVNLIWVQYAIELIRISHERLLQGEKISTNNLPCEVDNSSLTAPLLFDETLPVVLYYEEETIDYQSCTDQYLLNSKGVWELCNPLIRLIFKAIQYFDTNLYRLGETVLYMSRLCKYMFYFDRETFLKTWHDIRIKHLEHVTNRVSKSTDLQLKRIYQALHLELGLAYCTSLDMEEEILVRTGEDLNKEATEKLYIIVNKIIYYFKCVEIYDHELKKSSQC